MGVCMARLRITALFALGLLGCGALCPSVIGLIPWLDGPKTPTEPASGAADEVETLASINGDGADCGPACLYLLCKLAGRPSTLSALREQTKMCPLGRSMLDLKNAAVSMGFHAEARNGTWAVLRRCVVPKQSFAVLHVNGDHFVVAAASPDGSAVRIADPARGVRDFDEEGFRREFKWEGNMLLLTAPESREAKDQ